MCAVLSTMIGAWCRGGQLPAAHSRQPARQWLDPIRCSHFRQFVLAAAPLAFVQMEAPSALAQTELPASESVSFPDETAAMELAVVTFVVSGSLVNRVTTGSADVAPLWTQRIVSVQPPDHGPCPKPIDLNLYVRHLFA